LGLQSLLDLGCPVLGSSWLPRACAKAAPQCSFFNERRWLQPDRCQRLKIKPVPVIIIMGVIISASVSARIRSIIVRKFLANASNGKPNPSRLWSFMPKPIKTKSGASDMPGFGRNCNRFITRPPLSRPLRIGPIGGGGGRPCGAKKTGLVSQGVTEKPGEFRISTIVGLRRTSTGSCTRDPSRNHNRADKEQSAAARKIQKA